MKTMIEIENQAYRLRSRLWSRFQQMGAFFSEARKSADDKIGRAYLNSAASMLNKKAKEINCRLSVRPMHQEFCVALEYVAPEVGITLKMECPFCIEAFLNNPKKVLEQLNA